jgi:hypothetical protein
MRAILPIRLDLHLVVDPQTDEPRAARGGRRGEQHQHQDPHGCGGIRLLHLLALFHAHSLPLQVVGELQHVV